MCLALASLTLATAAPGAVRVVPSYKHLASSGNSTLWELVLPENASYTAGAPLVVSLKGDRKEIGLAYASLLGEQTIRTWEAFTTHIFPSVALRIAFEAFADWLWDRFASKHVPQSFLEELAAMKAASPAGKRVSVDTVTRRFNVLGNLPADPQNIITMLEQELEKGLPPAEAALINEIIRYLDKCSW